MMKKKFQTRNDTSELEQLEKLIEKWEPILSAPLSSVKVEAILLESRETWNLKNE